MNIDWSTVKKDDGFEKNFKLVVPESSDIAPLIYGFEKRMLARNVEIVYEIPARLSSLEFLLNYDAALVPTIAYARSSSELMIVPECGVASNGKIRTARLYIKENLRVIKSIALDHFAMTEVAMTKIILAEKYAISPSFVVGGTTIAEMLDVADAALVVGNSALISDKEMSPNYLDLGEEWEDMTGLPFVHFIWAAKRNSLDFAQLQKIIASRNLGVDNLKEIIREVSEHLGLPPQAVTDHFEGEVYYEIGKREIEGMRQFFELAYYHRLLEYIPSINFFSIE